MWKCYVVVHTISFTIAALYCGDDDDDEDKDALMNKVTCQSRLTKINTGLL